MDNFPEKQEDLEAESSEELSTVFSDPSQEGKKSADKKKKLRWPVAAATLLAVALLVGATVAIVKFIPEMTSEEDSSGSSADISVLALDSDELKTVKITNINGSFSFYSETETDSDGFESVNWYVEGYDKKVVDSGNIGDIVDAAAQISAFREITEKSSEDCGLNEPSATVEITTNDDAVISVYVGNVSPDNRGTYLKLSTDEKIYLVESFDVSAFTFEEIYLADSDDFDGIELSQDAYSDYLDDSEKLETFDTLTVAGANFPQEVVIAPNTNETIAQYAAYMVTSPSTRIAANVDDLFAIFRFGITVDGAYSFDVSEKTLRELGLDSPDFTVTLKVKNQKFTYKFKLQQDGNYAVIGNGSLVVKSVAADELSFIDYETKDFYSKWVSMESIDTLTGFKLKSPDGEYAFTVSKKDGESEYDVSCSGKEIKSEYFQAFYEQFVSLTCSEYTTESLTAEPAYTVTLSFNDGRSDAVLTFTKATETKYQYALNGVDMGKVNSSALKKISKYAAKVSQNQSIN